MNFLAPAVLAGLGVVLAPIAIHLLNKRRVKVVRWGATRFLLESLRKNRSRLRMEDLLLLLLRCVLIALLAFAFARPVLNPGGSANDAGTGPATVILLLDQSASMQQSNGFETRFDQAKTAARKQLDKLGSGSQAALFLVTNRVNQVVSRPTSNLALVRHALDLATPTDRAADLSSAIKVALDALRASAGASKEIVVFTDNQVTAGIRVDEIKAALAAAPDVRVRFVSGAENGEDNLAVTGLSLASNMAAAGQLFGCVVEVSNFGSTPAQGTRVTLSANEGPPIDEGVVERIEPGKSATLRLSARFEKPGSYTLTAAIGSDRMPIDNERALAIRVIDRVSTVIVEGNANAAPPERAGFFIANALAPISPSRRESHYLKTEMIAAGALQSAELNGKQIVFLCDVPRLEAGAAQNLQRYVREGGALVVFPGPQVKAAAYTNDPVLREMLPATMADPQDGGAETKFVSWQGPEYRHPITALWNDKENGNLSSVRTARFFPLTLAPAVGDAAAARAIVNYADGTPAIAEKSYGKGRVVLFSSTATTQWNNLPIHPNFVPLLQRLVGFVAPDQQSAALNLAPGNAFQGKVTADLVGREISVVRPDDKGKPRPAGKVELVNQEAVVRYRDTERAGGYRFLLSDNQEPIAGFSVQIDPAESDLRTVPPAQLAALSGDRPAAGSQAGATPSVGVRRELWAALIFAAAIIALLEMVLAHKFSFAK